MSSYSPLVLVREFEEIVDEIARTLPAATQRLEDIRPICGQFGLPEQFSQDLDDLCTSAGWTSGSGRRALAQILLHEDSWELWIRYDDIRARAADPSYETIAR